MKEDAFFIEAALQWRKGYSFQVDDCIFYNFGYEKEFPLAQIHLNTKSGFSVVLNSKGIEAPNLCSAILIAGKYLDEIDEVMNLVNQIAEETNNVPIAAFLFRTHENQKININNHLR